MWHYFILLQVLVAHWVGTLQWRPIEHDCVSNHQSGDCLLNRLFMCRSKKKLHVTGLCAGNSPVTGEFPTQKASNAENVSIWWRHHGEIWCYICIHSDLIQTISYYLIQTISYYWLPVTGEFPSQRPVMWSFDVFFDLGLNKWLSKQSRRWWFETLSS